MASSPRRSRPTAIVTRNTGSTRAWSGWAPTGPWLVTWDDHEVSNDYADQWSEYFGDPAQFLIRRAAAYRAFYEHMPLRPMLSHPDGPIMRVYDRFTLGDLVEISLLDGRQYRSREACYRPPNKGGGHLESNSSSPRGMATGRTRR